MSTSSSSTLEDMRHSSALQDLSSEALAMHPPTLKTNPHGRHASWADHKFTSDGDILTLDSPRPSGDRDGFMDGHVRSLSGQLFGMNLSPDNSITYSPDQPHEFTESEDRETSVHSPKETSSFNHNISTFPTQEASGRKHRRGCSEGKTNPVVAHRRMDSGGNVAFINRQVEHTQPMPSSSSGQQNGTSSFRYHHYPIPLQQQNSREHERKASPNYDQSQRYGQVQAFPPHRSNQLPQHRSSSYPSRLSHQYPSPRQDTYDYYREDEMYRRSYPQGVPPRYQSNRGGYPVYGAMDSGISQHRYPSPHNGSFPDEVGSHNANTGPYASYNRYPQSHPSQRDDNLYYPPPRGGTQYPVQYANDANERRYAALPQHPLADNGCYCPYAPPHYRRQTSHNSLGTGSDGRIETDENLFAGESRAIMSSSPRKSPQLFDMALHGKPIPSHISSSPPEFVSYSGGLSEDGRGSQGPTFPPIPPAENRIRTASSDSNIKQFIKAVEISQAHKRGESTDSFIFNDSLFGENILEPNALDSNVNGEVDPVDSLAPIPVSTGEAISSGPPVASINIPPPTSSHYEFNQYDYHPDITRSHSISPPYSNSSTHGEISKASTLPRLDSALSKAYSTSSNSTTMESSDSKPMGRQITGKVSKRARRKCSVENCQNRVVQGGLCIAHGAKRKLCGHPGCNKHVKKAGMCSAHGPPRKLCEYEGCNKVAVQGGRCISHGAKKKLCSVEDCKKQAILGGMCKKHHDEESGRGHTFCQSVYTDEPCGESPEPRNKPTHTRGLSIFTDNDIQEKIIKREINL